MRDLSKKLEAFLNVCSLQSAPDDEGEQKVTIPKNVNKCSLVFAHPEVFVGDKSVKYMRENEVYSPNLYYQYFMFDERTKL